MSGDARLRRRLLLGIVGVAGIAGAVLLGLRQYAARSADAYAGAVRVPDALSARRLEVRPLDPPGAVLLGADTVARITGEARATASGALPALLAAPRDPDALREVLAAPAGWSAERISAPGAPAPFLRLRPALPSDPPASAWLVLDTVTLRVID